MSFPIIITQAKFSAYYYIKKHKMVDMNNYNSVIDEAWEVWGTRLTREDCQYLKNNYHKLEKEFKGGKQ